MKAMATFVAEMFEIKCLKTLNGKRKFVKKGSKKTEFLRKSQSSQYKLSSRRRYSTFREVMKWRRLIGSN